MKKYTGFSNNNLLVWILLPILAFFISMNAVFAYFTATASGVEKTTSTAVVTIKFADSTNAIVNSNVVTGSSRLLPGETLVINSAIENTGTVQVYAIFSLKIHVTKSGSSVKETVVDDTYTIVNSQPVKLFLKNMAYNAQAFILDPDGTGTDSRSFTLSHTFDVMKYDNSYKNATITYELRGKAIQTPNLTQIKATNELLNYNPPTITLLYDNADDKNFGIEQRRVFGIQSYHRGGTESYIPLDYEVSEELEDLPLYWFVSNENYASVETIDGMPMLVTNTYNLHTAFSSLDSSITDRNDLIIPLTVTVGNKSTLEACTITDSYTFNLVPGINVSDSDGFNHAHMAGLNVVLHNNLVATATDVENGLGYDIYTPITRTVDNSSWVYLPEKDTNPSLTNSFSIYGNGYMLSFGGAHNVRIMSDITNVTIKQFSSSNTSTYDKSITVHASDVHVNYSKVSNFQHIYLTAFGSTPTYHFKNSVISNAKDKGLMTDGSDGSSTVVYIEDCVMSNLGQCAIAANNGKFYIKGRFDVYNFKTANEVSTDYARQIETAYNNNPQYSSTNSSGNKVANVAIAAAPSGTLSTTPNVSDIYFWNGSSYVANSATMNGITYNKMTVNITVAWVVPATMHLWLPANNSRITPNSDVDESVVYRLHD